MGKIWSNGTGEPAVFEVQSSNMDSLLTLDLQSTWAPLNHDPYFTSLVKKQSINHPTP